MLGACSGSGVQNGAPDLAPPPDLLPANPDLIDGQPSTMYPAPHPAPPQVVSSGGPVLNAPVLVPVFFSNDDTDTRTSLADFYSKVGATNYWMTAVQEYGVGAATAKPPIVLTETATGTIDDSAIQTWLAGKLNGNDAQFPTTVENTIFALNYPSGVTITLNSGQGSSQSCQSFGAYHSNIKLDTAHGGALVSYAVIPRCSGGHAMSLVDTATASASHELIEAVTDPYPQTNAAYGQTDDDHIYWAFALGGGEVGDLCAQDPTAFTKFPELNYTVQRTWSNASALAGHDPCVPLLPNVVYFNTVPELPDTITIGGGAFSSAGVQVPVGMSKTIPLDFFSDAPTSGPWTIQASDYGALVQGGAPNLQLTLDRTSGSNGERAQLTIKTLKAGQFGAGIFVIVSKLGGRTNYWFGLVGEQ
jgi:hypothetical protein